MRKHSEEEGNAGANDNTPRSEGSSSFKEAREVGLESIQQSLELSCLKGHFCASPREHSPQRRCGIQLGLRVHQRAEQREGSK